MTIEQRLQRLEDIRAIERLKYDYAAFCDDGYDAEGIAGLFTEDGSWVVDGEGGSMNGRAEIAAHFRALPAHITWALHFVTQPRVDIADDGQSATGRFYLLCLCTIDGDAVVLTLNYTDRFEKRDGRWMFTELRGRTHQVSNWDQAWVKQRFR
ncbi:hypothetical protein ASG29_14710 [Sphingomonas sp. Leaf412]|uniref:nuclear transport factor 2 family protein n=1 Tax=Sphingomonas sp. Leaf412 TaxID=1736370 RepID=UPI0006F9CC46|nr:nuclear transport factor 2 family protein [Sphingomonas sp. Leaf412]KQT31224.1 hypothetical protein ASG29_14710 [Sphingomonas sp. Leaf412]